MPLSPFPAIVLNLTLVGPALEPHTPDPKHPVKATFVPNPHPHPFPSPKDSCTQAESPLLSSKAFPLSFPGSVALLQPFLDVPSLGTSCIHQCNSSPPAHCTTRAECQDLDRTSLCTALSDPCREFIYLLCGPLCNLYKVRGAGLQQNTQKL